jgi:hypothetical protein
MAGKRPDQYRIAPDEAGATDYKQYPNEPSDVDSQRDKAKRRIAGDRHGGDLAEVNKRILKGHKKRAEEQLEDLNREKTENVEEGTIE